MIRGRWLFVRLSCNVYVCMYTGPDPMLGGVHHMLLTDLYWVGRDARQGPLYVWYVIFGELTKFYAYGFTFMF